MRACEKWGGQHAVARGMGLKFQHKNFSDKRDGPGGWLTRLADESGLGDSSLGDPRPDSST